MTFVSSPRSKSAAKRARKKAAKVGGTQNGSGPHNVEDMTDAQVSECFLHCCIQIKHPVVDAS